MGEDCSSLKMVKPFGFYAYYSIHSLVGGKFLRLEIDNKFRSKHFVSEHLTLNKGDTVLPYIGSNGTIGILILKFNSMEEMLDIIDNINNYVKVVLE